MAWTYSGNPALSNRDEVRFLAGDVVHNAVLSLEDAEVDWLITQAHETPPNLYHVAADVAEMMAGRAAAQAATSRKIGDLEIADEYRGLFTQFHALAERLMAGRTRFNPGLPVFQDTNTAIFSIGIHDDLSGGSASGF